jgi:predicted nucleic acid-binding protein
MKKLKLYLDTSVISHLRAEDVPIQMADTLKLWDEIKIGLHYVVISDLVIDEIMRCPQPKCDMLLKHLAEIDYSRVEITDEIKELGEQIIKLGILKEKSRDDCLHIATAVVCRCDYILSWNFKHIVNVRTIKGVRAITNLCGYSNIDIIQPTMLVEKGG